MYIQLDKKLPYFFVWILFGGLLSACNLFDSESSEPLKGNLIGKWQEVIPDSIHVLAGTLSTYNFKTDSFYVEIIRWNDEIDTTNRCRRGSLKEYSKGKYSIEGDSIFFNGVYTDSNFSGEVIGCFDDGIYDKRFYIKFINEIKFNLRENPNYFYDRPFFKET